MATRVVGLKSTSIKDFGRIRRIRWEIRLEKHWYGVTSEKPTIHIRDYGNRANEQVSWQSISRPLFY